MSGQLCCFEKTAVWTSLLIYSQLLITRSTTCVGYSKHVYEMKKKLIYFTRGEVGATKPSLQHWQKQNQKYNLNNK